MLLKTFEYTFFNTIEIVVKHNSRGYLFTSFIFFFSKKPIPIVYWLIDIAFLVFYGTLLCVQFIAVGNLLISSWPFVRSDLKFQHRE